MKKAKRIAAFLLSVLLLVLFVACNSPASSAGGGTTAPSTGGQASTDAGGDKVQLTFSLWGGEEEQKVTQAVLDNFNATQDRIEVTAVAIPWETYTEKLNTMATANELPDAGMVNE